MPVQGFRSRTPLSTVHLARIEPCYDPCIVPLCTGTKSQSWDPPPDTGTLTVPVTLTASWRGSRPTGPCSSSPLSQVGFFSSAFERGQAQGQQRS